MAGFICTQGTNLLRTVREHVNLRSGCVNGGSLLEVCEVYSPWCCMVGGSAIYKLCKSNETPT